MKQIGTDIIARMLHDYLKCEILTLKAIPGFKVNSVSYEMLGPVFDNDYGMMYSCNWYKSVNDVMLRKKVSAMSSYLSNIVIILFIHFHKDPKISSQ